jgi:hypothetical protein
MKADHSTNSRSATTAARTGMSSLSVMLQTVVSGGDSDSLRSPATSFLRANGSDMQTKTTTRRGPQPRMTQRPDRHSEIGGEVIGMTAVLQKQIAGALGYSEGYVSKLIGGHPAAGAYLRAVARAAEAKHTDAGPLAVAPIAELARALAKRFTSDQDIDAAVRVALRIEGEREATENAATLARLLAGADGCTSDEIALLEQQLAKAMLREAAASLLVVGLLWERDRRRERAH